MQNERPPGDTVRSVETSYEILDALQRMDGARITELADELGLASSTIHRHLSTLENLEFVVNQGSQYHIGLRYLSLGAYAREYKQAYRLAKHRVAKLADETGERAQFVVEEHGRGIHIFTRTGDNAVTADAGIGKRVYLHASSAGKSILAFVPEQRRQQILDTHGLPQITDNTVTDRDVLLDELNDIRDRGFASNKEESIEGLRAVGAPVVGESGVVMGALSVSAPTHRMKGNKIDNYIDALLGIVNELELNIEYS
jgi:DNA-binding IclR family transcriptional regulator